MASAPKDTTPRDIDSKITDEDIERSQADWYSAATLRPHIQCYRNGRRHAPLCVRAGR